MRDSLGMLEREIEGDLSAHRYPNDRYLVDVQLIQECANIFLIGKRHPWKRRVTEAPQIQTYDTMRGRKVPSLVVPHRTVGDSSVNE